MKKIIVLSLLAMLLAASTLRAAEYAVTQQDTRTYQMTGVIKSLDGDRIQVAKQKNNVTILRMFHITEKTAIIGKLFTGARVVVEYTIKRIDDRQKTVRKTAVRIVVIE